MKLRNKKTGMIGEVGYLADSSGEIIVNNINDQDEWYTYSSLAELNEEWEDYEEPKEFYFIDQFMSVSKGVVDDVEYAGRNSAVNYAKKTSNNLKTAGNYFETREEAEKAVEKLKAFKRLKEAGFEFKKWKHKPLFSYHYGTVKQNDGYKIYIEAVSNKLAGYMQDLDLLFGGEE